MKLLKFPKQLLFSAILMLAMGFVLQSCQVEEPIEVAAAPTPAAAAGGYGNCSTCPFPANISGQLSNQLINPNSDWFAGLNSCLLEATPANCQLRKGIQPIIHNYQLSFPNGQFPNNDQNDFCIFLFQIANEIDSNHPSGNWVLNSINSMAHLGGPIYEIEVSYRKYICKALPTTK